MRRLLAAAVCCLALLACSPGTSSPEAAPADASTSRSPSRDPGSATEGTKAPQPRELSVQQWNKLTCWGRRPTIVGTMTDDRIRGTRAQDVIISRGGNSALRDGRSSLRTKSSAASALARARATRRASS
jgi:hypothetical protein